MQIRCDSCARGVTVADTGVLPERCPHCDRAPVPDALGRWRIERLLAAGGMGEVYVARHAALGTEVAIKLLPHGPGTADVAVLRERFAREARLTAAIAHPGVVRVIDFDAAGERAFLVLELVDGRSLRSLLRDGPLAVERALAIVGEVADVLAAAHAQGVVHRDIKPENVVVGRDGRVRVLDFGIARALADEQPITRTGEILGTPEYMAPEQLLDGADAIDARTDVHALGVLLFELLTGRSPFAGHNLFQVLKLVESLEPPAPSTLRRDLPPELDAVVARALAKEPDARFADAADFAAALPGAPAPPRLRRSRRRAVLGVAGVVIGAVCGGVLGSLWGASGVTVLGGDDPAIVVPATAAARLAEIELVLDAPAADPADLRRARTDLARALDDDAADSGPIDASAAHRALGRVDLQLGAFHSARRELRRAADFGSGDAAETAAVADVLLRVLLPSLAGAPAWLAATERAGVGPGPAGDDGGEAGSEAAPWSAAARRVIAGRDAEALALLRDHLDGAAPARRALALVAAWRSCPDAGRVRDFAARWQPADADPAWQLATALLGPQAERLATLSDQVDRCAPDAADRWLAELCRARLAVELGEGSLRRLTAAAELAWLTGAGPLAVTWYAAFRLDLVRHGHPLERDAGRSLLRLVGGIENTPAAAVTLGLLRVAIDEPGALFRELADLVDLPDHLPPGLRVLHAATATPRLAIGAGRLWLADRAAACRDLEAVDSGGPRAADAALLLAAHGDEDGSVERWTRALIGGADPGWLDLVPPRHPPTAEVLAAAVAAGVEPIALWPVIRAAVRAGVPLETLLAPPALAPLRPAAAEEVYAGLPE